MKKAELVDSFYDREEEVDYIQNYCEKKLDRAVAYKESCGPHCLLEGVLKDTPYKFIHLTNKEIEETCEDSYIEFFQQPDTSYYDVVR
jgi:uncharacterized hydantoinase/oxoprolinase family protein